MILREITIICDFLKLSENQTKAITKTVTSRVTSPRSSRSGSLKVLRSSLIDPTSINGAGSTSPKNKPSRNSSNTSETNGITNAELGVAVLPGEIGAKESVNGTNFNQKSWLESQGAVVNDSKPPKYGQTPRKRLTNETRNSSFDMVGSNDVGKSIQNPNHRSWSTESGSKSSHTEKPPISTPPRGVAPPRTVQTPLRGAQPVVNSPVARTQIPINPSSPRRRPEKPAKPEKFQRMAKESPGGSAPNSMGMLPPKGAPPRQRPPPRRQSSLQYDTSSIKTQEMSPPVPIPKPLEPIESRLGFQNSNMFQDYIGGHGDALEYQSKGIKIHNEPNEAQIRSSMKTPDTFQNQPQMTHPRFNSKTMPHSTTSPSGQVSSRPVPKPRKSIQRRNSYHR